MLTQICCMRLKTFGVVIGWVGILGSSIGVIIMSIVLSNVGEIVKSITDKANDDNLNLGAIETGIIVVCSIYLGLGVINLLSSALLIAGIINERHLLMVPWLFNSIFSFIFSTLYQILMTSIMVLNGVSFENFIPSFLLSITFLIIHYYVIYAIYLLFKQIKANSGQQQQLLQPTGGNLYPSYTKI